MVRLPFYLFGERSGFLVITGLLGGCLFSLSRLVCFVSGFVTQQYLTNNTKMMHTNTEKGECVKQKQECLNINCVVVSID